MPKTIIPFFLKNLSPKQIVLKNTFWLFAGETSRILKGLIIIYATRILGPTEWGIFAYAITLANFFAIFTDIGINGILTREIVKNQKLINYYLSTSFYIKLPLLIISVALTVFVAPLLTNMSEINPLLKIIVLIFAIDVLREFSFSVVRALEKMEIEALVKTLTNVGVATFSFVFLALWAKPYFLALGYFLGDLFGFLVIIWFLRAYLKNIFLYFSKTLVPKILSSAWPFALISLFGTILVNTDVLMLGWFKPSYEIGLYAAAQRALQLIYLGPSLLVVATFPLFTKASANKAKFKDYFEKILSLMFLLTLPIWIGGLISGTGLIDTFFGHEYLAASNAFKILLFPIIIGFPTILINNAIFIYDKQKTVISFIISGGILNLVLNYLLIPKYGIEGASLATTASLIFSNLFIWHQMKKIVPFGVLYRLKKIIMATVLMGLVTFMLQYNDINFLLNLILSALVYSLSLLLLREKLIREILTIIKIT